MTSLLKQLATNAINWDTGQHSALRTQEPQGQVPSLPSWWFNRIEMAPSSQPACHRKPSQGWSQGCSWMWQVSPRISWLTQGLPTLTWPPSLEPSPLNHFGCYKKKITKRNRVCILVIHLSSQSLFVHWLIKGLDGIIKVLSSINNQWFYDILSRMEWWHTIIFF